MGRLEGLHECLFFCQLIYQSNDRHVISLAPWNPTCLGVGCPSAWELWLIYSTTGRIQDYHGAMDNLVCMVAWSDCFLADNVFFWISAQKTGMDPVPRASWADLDCEPTNDGKYALCLLWSKFTSKHYFFSINSPFAFFVLILDENMPQILEFV